MLVYRPAVRESDEFADLLMKSRGEELARGITTVGPHRDDLGVTLADRDLAHFGSQGQHRSVLLALKLAEIKISRRVTGDAPILLLDDVASELDNNRLEKFLHTLQDVDCQIVLTTTHLENAKNYGLGTQRVIKVTAGDIKIID